MSLRDADLTRESYNKNAAHFIKRLEKPIHESTVKHLESFASSLTGKRILDAGCGTGIFSKWFSSRGFYVIGIDNSKAMVDYALASGVTARVMDLENITFPDESFDGIIAIASLLHMSKQNIHAVLESFHRILTKEGVLLVSLKKGEGERVIVDTVTGSEPISRFFSFWTVSEFSNVAKDLFFLVGSEEAHLDDNCFITFKFRKKIE